MAKTKAQRDPLSKRRDETDLQWRSRVASRRQIASDKAEPIVPIQTERHGDYRDSFVTHVESGTITRTRRNQISNIVDKWFAEGGIGFGKGAEAAVERCHACWAARPTLGKQTATYGENLGGGVANDQWDIELRDEVDEYKSWFPFAYWDVFENVVRWGKPAGVAGSELSNNNAQATASAKAIVGMIASFIAMKKGY